MSWVSASSGTTSRLLRADRAHRQKFGSVPIRRKPSRIASRSSGVPVQSMTQRFLPDLATAGNDHHPLPASIGTVSRWR